MTDPGAGAMNVAVVGGGWAGCAAAVTLANAGARVTLYEAAATLGGRARTVMRDGIPLDNGQHLMLGAYTQTRALLDVLHDGRPAARLAALAMVPLSPAVGEAVTLRVPRGSGARGLARAILRIDGLSWPERLGTIAAFLRWRRAAFRCTPDATVADLLARAPAAAGRRLWAPLCLAALNTPPERASAQVFLNVLAASFAAAPDAADVLHPVASLGDCVPDATRAWLEARGHAVHCNHRARVDVDPAGQLTATVRDAAMRFDAVVLAVGPHQLAHAVGPALAVEPPMTVALERTARLAYESITTVYLGYAQAKALPDGLVRLDDAPGQWLFDRSELLSARRAAGAPALTQLVAVVISAGGAHDALPHRALVSDTQAQLRRLLPGWPDAAWSKVIAERRATYACTPGLAHPPVEVRPGLALAGDYVYPSFPATLEAAVRSGRAAAAALSRPWRPSAR